VTASTAAPVGRRWVAAAATLAIGAAAFILAFRTEAARALQVWNESTAYNHCYLILPIAAYLVWERREALLVRAPSPSIWPVAAMVPVCLVWLLAARIQIMEGRQLAAMTLFELFVLAILGFSAWRVIAFALLYLYFLVPTGAFLTPALQDFATRFAVRGLEFVGIPVYSDGAIIEVPSGSFEVAEACAGLRFLIASIALGALYAYMIYRDWVRRAAFVVASVIVPIIANGLRVLGLVIYGNWRGNGEAALADHLIYGWVFFSMVSLFLIMIGLPFRQPIPDFPAPPAGGAPPRHPFARIAATGVLSIGLAAFLVSPIVSDGPLASAMDRSVVDIKRVLGR
jgi:exosortase A